MLGSRRGSVVETEAEGVPSCTVRDRDRRAEVIEEEILSGAGETSLDRRICFPLPSFIRAYCSEALRRYAYPRSVLRYQASQL